MIPEKFKEKMQDILEDEYPDFISQLENGTAVRGLRVNLKKTSVERFRSLTSLELEALPYVDNGFILSSAEAIGSSAYHHAGAIYMQDPGAMATAAALDVKADWWVADLCAAPGGKSTQIAERLGEDGFLLSNEYVPKRAKIIVGNLERLGIRNAMVTSLDTGRLAEMYSAVFDLVLADAPCSGEGMFRKSDEAIEDWSPENVNACSERQRDILGNAAKMVKPGGYLLYSTCTYSPEENECVVASFLKEHPDFYIAEVKAEVAEVTRPALAEYARGSDGIELARRFYPHVFRGEGQYLALLKKQDNNRDKPTILYKDSTKPLSKQESDAVREFFKSALSEAPRARVVKVNDNIVLISHDCPVPSHSVFMSGVLLGEMKGRTLAPSHQFFSAYGELFLNKITLLADGGDVEKYLRGEELTCDSKIRGWCCVTVDGIPLGGGKASDGRLKNHYPKGLRNK